MSEQTFPEIRIEPERYEMLENPLWLEEHGRRDFFRVVGAGLVVAFFLSEAEAQERQGRREGRGFRPSLSQEISAWLHIGTDGTVTAYTGKVELGQNIRTSLAQAVAEELCLPVDRVKMVMADTELVPFDMGTFGSLTTPMMASQLHRVAAAARDLLLDMAAEQGKVDRKSLHVEDGKVVQKGTGKSYSFGELTQGKKLMKAVGRDVKATPAKEWKVAGTSAPKADGRDFVTGAHQYASDVRRPGMLYGKVLRPHRFKAKLATVDTKAAGAGLVVVHEGDFVGVAAPTEYEAEKALAAVRAEWQGGSEASDAKLYAHLKEHPGQAQGFGGRSRGAEGSVADGLKAADKPLSATYTIAYIAHAPLEPRSAVAEWAGDKVTVWTGTQRPFAVRDEVANALGVPREKVRVIVPDTGSGYGGKHTGEAAVEAARLARAAKKPVRVAWTREEEFTWAYFRPAGVIDVSAGVTKDGKLTAWEFHNYNSGGSGLATPYTVANRHQEFHSADSPLRQGSYRVLAATANHFARESHMDDLAHAVGIDPLEFRLRNLKDERLRAVFEAAAKQFGWGQKPSAGRGVGLAGGVEKGGYVATCAEVAADGAKQRVRVTHLVTAFDCGAVVNPEHLKNQIEGALVMGLGGALFEEIHFGGGTIRNPKFSQYRVPRFADLPRLEVVLLDRKDLASAGAGEAPILAVAPAVANAIVQATGTRIRSMPLVPNGLKVAADG